MTSAPASSTEVAPEGSAGASGSLDRFVDAMHRIVTSIQSSGDLPELLSAIMEESRNLLGSDASSLFLYDPERNDLYFEIVVGGDEKIRAIRVPMGQGIVGATARDRRTEIVNDVASDSRHMKVSGGFVTKNLIAVPMLRGDRLIGVLEVLNKREGGFDDMDAKILEIMAEQAAGQIENARLVREKIRGERLAALGTTAAGLAHYIKNILGTWKGSSSLIEMGLKRNDMKMIVESWEVMKRSNAKIAKLVQDMLVISRDREPERQEVDVNRLCESILDEIDAKAAQAGVALAGHFATDVPAAQLDPAKLHDVILNLVGNAVEAIEENRLDGRTVTVRTSFRPSDFRIVVVVQDDGPGMPPEIRQRVFEPFFSTKGSRGTGLGLAVAIKSVEEHGGRMRLESEVGVGSTFTMELPAES